MPLRKRGEMGGCEGFIDLDQMRNSLPGDPSDSDPGHEVTNLIHKISINCTQNQIVIHCCDEFFFPTGQICYYPAMIQNGISLWIVRKPVDSVLACG